MNSIQNRETDFGHITREMVGNDVGDRESSGYTIVK